MFFYGAVSLQVSYFFPSPRNFLATRKNIDWKVSLRCVRPVHSMWVENQLVWRIAKLLSLSLSHTHTHIHISLVKHARPNSIDPYETPSFFTVKRRVMMDLIGRWEENANTTADRIRFGGGSCAMCCAVISQPLFFVHNIFLFGHHSCRRNIT